MNLTRRALAPFIPAAILCLSAPAHAGISGNAYGQAYESNNLIQEDSEVVGNSPEFQTGVITAESDSSAGVAKAGSYLFQGALGASGAASASGMLVDIPGTGEGIRAYQANGVGNVSYTDTLTITSDTLPAGTLVSVKFCWAVDLVLETQHSSYGTGNFASAGGSLNFSATPSFPYNGFSHFDTASSAGNGSAIKTGVWDTGMAEQTIDVAVGTTIQFLVALNTSASVGAGNQPALIEPANGAAQFCAAIAFGAAALTPDVTIHSTYLDGEFPTNTDCTPADATPFIPDIPSPTTPSLLALAVIATTRRRRP